MPRTDSSASPEPVWLCLHFSQLALAVFERDPARPAIAIEQRRVWCSNRDNLEPGLAVSTASSLYADLLMLEREPQREAELLQNLACLAYGFTPMVTAAAGNSLLLEIGSCRLFYRGLSPLLALLQSALEERGHAVLSGVAHTPKAAWLLARRPHLPALIDERLHIEALYTQLAAVPIDDLQIAANDRAALQQMGLATLGAVQALPYAAVGKRFGADVVNYLQQLWGDSADLQDFFRPAPVFRQGLTFLDGVPQRQMLRFPMKRLLQRLCDYLRARQLLCHVLRWRLYDAHAVQADIVIELSRTQNDLPALLELSRIKLDQVVLKESVFSLSLHSEDFFEAAPASTQLFPDAREQDEAGHALFDRLRARLGSDALQRIEPCESLWPERSWQVADHPTAKRPAVRGGGPRPLWLLPQPQPLRERDGLPLWKTALTLLRGPERVDNHWWQAEGASRDYQVRDYFVARTHDDRLCWVYREFFLPLLDSFTASEQASSEDGATSAVAASEPLQPLQYRWFLHGWFA
ncbi:MAG: dinP [Verrucomicrobiaceae bacterium]|nr:dinP [Verrucomicrobiaceae bacterium]